MSETRFAILGTLEVTRDGKVCDLGPTRQQIALALLLCQANTVVPVRTLTDTLWGDDPPRTVRKNLQVYMSTLRGLLGLDADQLAFRGHGYVLRVGPAELDLLRFSELTAAGRRALRGGDVAGGARLLGEAMRLRRGPVLASLTEYGAIEAEVARLENAYVSVCEDWAEAELELGFAAVVLEQLDELVRREPYRERLRRAQLLALHRCGRRAEALAEYDAVRQVMARELGLEPSPVLRGLYEAILADDPALRPGDPGPGAARPRRGPVLAARLPRDVPSLHGHDDEAVRLLGGLPKRSPGGLALITGPPGAGKTALAVHVAHRLAGQFPDGQLFVRLRSADGRQQARRDVLSRLLRGLGWEGAVPGRPEACAALAQTLLAGRRFLMVLDDAPDEASVRPLLPDTGPACVLVTSQRRLAGLDVTDWVTLLPFDPGAAVEMLAGIIGLRRVMTELDSARRIVTACSLLPLPIRVAGARMLGLPHLPLAAFAARLDDERRLLDELTIGDMGLRPRLSAWYQSLTAAERVAIGLVGGLHVPFGVSEAGELLGAPPSRVEQTLDRLVAAHAIEPVPDGDLIAHNQDDGPRYRVPAFVRAFVSSLSR